MKRKEIDYDKVDEYIENLNISLNWDSTLFDTHHIGFCLFSIEIQIKSLKLLGIDRAEFFSYYLNFVRAWTRCRKVFRKIEYSSRDLIIFKKEQGDNDRKDS